MAGAAARPSWRTLLQSPLGSFLTGVKQHYPFIQLAGHKGEKNSHWFDAIFSFSGFWSACRL